MLCVSEMAEALQPQGLAKMLGNSYTASDIIIIDCRPLLVMNTSRIQGAHGVHCPPIVKRRSGGNIPLENIIRNSSNREAFLSGRYSCIVMYDDNTESLSGLAKDSNMYLVIKTLSEVKTARESHNVYFLQGGFQLFQRSYPHWCTSCCDSPAVSIDIPTVTAVCHDDITTTDATTTTTTDTAQAQTHNHQLHPPHPNVFRERADSYSKRNKEGPKEVLPWLLIGNLHHASQVDNLLKLGVTTLINMAASTESSPIPSPHFCYKNIPVRDSCSADILQWFPVVIDSIEEARRSKGRVLVHCQAGISRSATVCIAYLMYYKRLDLEQAFDFLKEKRAVISPNLNFMRQLTEFQAQLKEGTSNVRQRAPSLKSPKLTLNLLAEPHACSSSGSSSIGGLSLTPCMQNTFAFDSPFVPSSTACGSTVSIHSPLMSPS